MFPADIAKFLRIAFSCNTSGGCFWQSYHGTVKSAGVPVLWIRASTCFLFWSKTFRKRWSNNPLLSPDKTIPFLLDLIAHVLLISDQNRFWKNINCFCFWWKTYKKCCTSNYENITCQKTFFPLYFKVGLVLSISEYDLESGTWRWKSRFWFCSAFVYFADLKSIYFTSCLYCKCKLF